MLIFRIILLFLVLISTYSCAYFKVINAKKSETQKLQGNLKYEFVDTMGSFVKLRQKGLDNEKNIIVKSKIFFEGKEEKPVEKLISISSKQKLQKDLRLLQPRKSEATYWFDGHKYKSTIVFDETRRQFLVQSRSTDKTWNKTYKFPLGKKIKAYCFFSQVVECAISSGFFLKSRLAKSGAMNMDIVWDGYPFFNEQYLKNKREIMSRGKLSYSGKEAAGIHKYSLNIDGQMINYFIYEDKYLAKMFWVSQGISQTLVE